MSVQYNLHPEQDQSVQTTMLSPQCDTLILEEIYSVTLPNAWPEDSTVLDNIAILTHSVVA